MRSVTPWRPPRFDIGAVHPRQARPHRILDLWVADEHYVLREGDAITFPCRLPRWRINRGEEPATVLSCVTPPSI